MTTDGRQPPKVTYLAGFLSPRTQLIRKVLWWPDRPIGIVRTCVPGVQDHVSRRRHVHHAYKMMHTITERSRCIINSSSISNTIEVKMPDAFDSCHDQELAMMSSLVYSKHLSGQLHLLKLISSKIFAITTTHSTLFGSFNVLSVVHSLR